MEAEGAKPAPEFRNLEETARFFDVTAPTVRGWIKDGCPAAAGGSNGVPYKLELRAVASWRQNRVDADRAEVERRVAAEAQLRLELLGSDALPLGDGPAPPTAKQRADALAEELNRIRLAKDRGDLVNAADQRLRLAEVFALARERLRALPDRLARRFGLADDVVAATAEEIDSLLGDLADELEGVVPSRPTD